MGAGMIPKGGGGGGVLGFDFFGNQGANPKPRFSEFSTSSSFYPGTGIEGGVRGQTPSMQTAQQSAAWNKANSDWREMKDLREQRQAMYQEMAQKTGPTPPAFNQNRGGGTRQAGAPLAMGGAPAYEKALYGQPRKWRDQYASIVNLRTA